jgi:hypothetical protein
VNREVVRSSWSPDRWGSERFIRKYREWPVIVEFNDEMCLLIEWPVGNRYCVRERNWMNSKGIRENFKQLR